MATTEYKTSSAEELKAAVNHSKGNDVTKIPGVPNSSKLFTYDESDEATYMLGVNINNGLGGVLAQGLMDPNASVTFTDNGFLDYIGNKSEVPNFNAWSREMLEQATPGANARSVNPPLPYQLKQRQHGTVFLTGNYELGFAGPLDSRLTTETLETLVNPSWWIGSFKRPVYFYKGMVVAVKEVLELYIYTGIDMCIKWNDPTSTSAISLDNWKRVSFEPEDILNTPLLIFSHAEAKAQNGIQTLKASGWYSENAIFISAEKTLNDMGITVATDYILLGQHYNPAVQKSCKRRLISGGLDMFNGLSIIPHQPYKSWDKNTYKTSTERVELQAVEVPLILRGRYGQDSSGNAGKNFGIDIRPTGIGIHAAGETIRANAKTLSLANVSYITLGNITSNSSTYKQTVDRSYQLKSGMMTMEVTGGTYLSTGDEANIVAGAFALHTTGYTESQLASNDSILMNPISFNYTGGYQASKYCMCGSGGGNSGSGTTGPLIADYVKVYDLNKLDEPDVELNVIPVAGQDPYQTVKYSNHESLTTEFPNITLNSAADFTTGAGNSEQEGFLGGSYKSATIPPTTSANFNRTHNANLRLTTQLIAQFTNEVDSGNMQIIDLGDKNTLTNSKKLVYATEKQFNQKVKEVLSQVDNKVEDVSALNLKLLNTDSELWVNTTEDKTITGNKTTLTKGYAIAGSTSVFNESISTQLAELINNGTVTIESFGDVSVYSNFGHVKLGRDGFVRMNRQKYFVVENNTDSYIRSTPSGIDIVYKGNDIATVDTITDATGEKYTNLNNTEKTGYIHLDAGIISFWDGYVLEKPVGTNQVLTYSSDSNDNKALCWKTQTNITGSVNNLTQNPLTLKNPNANENTTEPTDSQITWADTYYETRLKQCVYHKIGSFRYKGFVPQTGYDKTTNAITESHHLRTNAEIQVNLSSTVYAGNVNVDIQIYMNGNARVIVLDETIKYFPLKVQDPNKITLTEVNVPLAFIHKPCAIVNNDASDGEIEFWAVVPLNGDCHWSIHSTKDVDDNKTGYGQWIAVDNNTYAPVKFIPTVIYDHNKMKDPTAKRSDDRMEVVYQRPLIIECGPNTIDAANSELKLPDDSSTYTLQYNKNTYGLQWVAKNVDDGGVNISEINTTTTDSTIKTYLLGALSGMPSSNALPTFCKDSVIHRNIYFDPAGDLHASQFYSVSDARLKEDIKPINPHLTRLPKLKQFTFKHDKSQAYGFIAQELEELGYYNLVHIDEDGTKRVNYQSAYALLFSLMQLQIEEMRLKIIELEEKLQ